MTRLLTIICVLGMTVRNGDASTIAVVPVYEPLSLHQTDVDGAVTDIGEALQAAVLSRPMALTGAFPEAMVTAMRSPHLLPSNSPNYKVMESNLLVLCKVRLTAEMTQEGLLVTLDIGELGIPAEVDLTSRQVLKLALVALHKTLEAYQADQHQALKVAVVIAGAEGPKEPLKDLGVKFEIPGGLPR